MNLRYLIQPIMPWLLAPRKKRVEVSGGNSLTLEPSAPKGLYNCCIGVRWCEYTLIKLGIWAVFWGLESQDSVLLPCSHLPRFT